MTLIVVKRNLSVQSLIKIESPEFAKQYSMGVWWAMYGDEQGQGRYDESYLVGNILKDIERNWYGDADGIAHIGFYLGMIHGGNLDSQTGQQRQSVIQRLPLTVR
jgi:hypothetical protein